MEYEMYISIFGFAFLMMRINIEFITWITTLQIIQVSLLFLDPLCQ